MKKLFVVSLLTLCFSTLTLAKAPTIPKQFQGVWNKDAVSCASKDTTDLPQNQVTVKAKEFWSVDKTCELKSISKLTTSSVTGKFSCGFEGGEWETSLESRTLKLVEGKLVGAKFVNNGHGLALARCK